MARKSQKHPSIPVGQFVLAGGGRASLPGDWFLGEVLWAGNGDVLISRSTMNGDSYRQLLSVSNIRAIGTIEQLSDAQHKAAGAVREMRRRVSEAESALNRSRDAVWAKLNEMVEGGLKVIPPDFEQAERDRVATQEIIDRDDADHVAGRGPLVHA